MSSAGQVQENLPPIGVFWDIENCSVPSGRSAVTVVKRIRERFFKGHREAEFICVCDISKENKEVIEELNNCQVIYFYTFFFFFITILILCHLLISYHLELQWKCFPRQHPAIFQVKLEIVTESICGFCLFPIFLLLY